MKPSLQLTRYLAPVLDDGAPRSLQPFLQRASTLHVEFDAGGFDTANPYGGPDSTDSHVNANLGVDVSVYAVFERCFTLNLFGDAIQSGGEGGGELSLLAAVRLP